MSQRQSADYVALNVEPFEGTCDCCAESEKRIVRTDEDSSAYICEDCIAIEERAIQAGADALAPELRAHGVFWSMAAPDLARIVINAYINSKWLEEDRGGG